MSKRVLCKFFAHGACLKGEHCEFSHDWKDPPNNICTYYQKGFCSYGSRCRYEHVKPSRSESAASSSSSVSHPSRATSSGITKVPGVMPELSALSRPFLPPNKTAWNPESVCNDSLENDEVDEPRNLKPADRSICSFAAAGNCPRGEKCPHIHGDTCPTCGKQCLHPFRPEEREEHMKSCEKKQKHLEALRRSQEIECSVCLDRVLSKPTAAERKFGLLSECDHPFCISCIRNWRSSSPTSGMDVNTALRACPICRKLSYFVIPSVIWYYTPEEKQEIIDSYKLKLKSIDCKHFNFGNGNCPFGTSCFYKPMTSIWEFSVKTYFETGVLVLAMYGSNIAVGEWEMSIYYLVLCYVCFVIIHVHVKSVKHMVKPGSYMWKYHRPPPRRPPPFRPPPSRSNVVDMDSFIDAFGDLLGEDEPDFFDAENEHAYTDGRLEEVVLRHLGSDDGSTVIAKDIRLSEFLTNMHIR
ncbi:putative RING-type E3 ubiquitin transferase C3H69 [Citrus sinensis]|uniref:RING-type E3 ubiquitin transferase C3H69 n=1 Tax=Citrus sinensis TaxID=2711 RepID=A0ACB8LMI2_CITSI|nr:putative RING-type E3 ubiquitin transferase C3H69 [Citrus sinensis]